jgi:monoamine oxidase
LRAHGFDPVVLEARDRIGGRILTIRDARWNSPVELGAEFVHGRHPALWSLLISSRAHIEEVPSRGGGQDETDAVFDAMKRAPEQSFAEFVDKVAAPASAKRSATAFVEGFNAADRNQVSVEWLKAEEAASDEIEGERAFRLRSGYDTVANHLAHGLEIRLNSPVHRIDWQPGEVVFNGQLRAPRAIVTVPIAILAEGHLQIFPEPPILRETREAIGIGQAIRVVLRYSEAIDYTGFAHGGGSFGACWTDGPVATAWVAGPKAERLKDLTAEDLKGLASESLREMLKKDLGDPKASWLHDWRKDPYAREAYSYVRVNGMETQARLRLPIEDTIWLAGEAAGPAGHVGTVHGAIASGIDAAKSLASRAGRPS